MIEFAFDWGKVYLFEGRKTVDGAFFHSDQGWQYQMKEFQKMLSGLGLRQSMSRKGNCHDNAIMENFFGRLEVKMFYGEEKTFRYYEDFRKALEEYMLWYNQERVKEYLQWKSPILRRFKPLSLFDKMTLQQVQY